MRYIQITEDELKAMKGLMHDKHSIKALEHIALIMDDHPDDMFSFYVNEWDGDVVPDRLGTPIRGNS